MGQTSTQATVWSEAQAIHTLKMYYPTEHYLHQLSHSQLAPWPQMQVVIMRIDIFVVRHCILGSFVTQYHCKIAD